MNVATPRSRRTGRLVAVVVAAVLALPLLVVAAHPASAAGGDGWAVEPSGPQGPNNRDFFIYSLKAGQGLRDTVGITNSTDQPLTFKVYARDAFSAPGDGAFGVGAESETPDGVGSWVKLPDEAALLTVAPGTRTDVPFSITVPPDAEPGDHAGAIVAALQTPLQQSQEGSGLNVQQRIAARIYVRVDGTFQPAVAVNQIDVGYDNGIGALFGGRPAKVTYQVQNVGNLRMDPEIVIKLKDPLGRTVATSPFRQYKDLLPGGTLDLTESFEGVPPVGRLTAEVTVRSFGSAEAATTRTAATWSVPWLVVFGLIILGLLVALWLVRRRRRRSTPPPARPSAPPARPKEPVGV